MERAAQPGERGKWGFAGSGRKDETMKPLCIDLFAGLGGWADGFLAEGYDVIGFDIERHDYGTGGYPGQLVLQDVLTLDGRQFRNAAVIVASPPCQAYSYRAMPWKRAKALPPPDNTLFEACFRIAKEAGVPLIVENVRGAQKWVGRARWNFGSQYLWGDVPAMMPKFEKGFKGFKGFKKNWRECEASRRYSSKSKERKEWTASISKIPFPLAQHIARTFKP